MSSLIRGNELELAACVGIVLEEAASQSTMYCLELLARKYMTTPTWCVYECVQLVCLLLFYLLLSDSHWSSSSPADGLCPAHGL